MDIPSRRQRAREKNKYALLMLKLKVSRVSYHLSRKQL
jgi:hypothetical protein